MNLEEIGSITVSVYKDKENNSVFFINPSNDNVFSVVDILEDTLKLY